jgi:hypothetical protein
MGVSTPITTRPTIIPATVSDNTICFLSLCFVYPVTVISIVKSPGGALK